MKITIKDLREGINEFGQEIPAENYSSPELGSFSGPIRLKIFVDKLEDLFRFKISLQTRLELTCDRCLETFAADFNASIEQIYQLGVNELESDEIEVLPANTKEIDISKVIHDAFILNRPMKQLCREDCRGLCSNCGVNKNRKNCECDAANVDPRFEKLKSFLK
jgi:uncharacterized protein